MHLLLSVNFEPKIWKGVQLKSGQIIVGRKKLAEELGLGEQQIRRALGNLQNSQQITIKTTNKHSIITVCQWESYQKVNEQQPAKQPTNNQQSNQQTTTTKEVKKKEKKKGGKKIPSLEDLKNHNLNGHIQAWFEEKAPSVDRFLLRDKMIAYCEGTDKNYKDYWGAMRTWALDEQSKKIKKKPQQNIEEAMHGFEF